MMGNDISTQESHPTTKPTHCQLGRRPVTEAELGWDRPRFLEDVKRRWAIMEDSLPLEGATAEEEAQVSRLRAALLGAETAVQYSWHAHLYTRRNLLSYLRARGGHFEEAERRARTCIAGINRSFEAAAAFEAAPAEQRALLKQEHFAAVP